MKILLISLDSFAGSLGLRSISAYLKKRGHTVQILFLIPNERLDYDSYLSPRIFQQLNELAADSEIIGVSTMTNEFRACVAVVDHLRKLNKPVVWGGIHATSCPEECIKYADMLCLGEGEEAFCELVESIGNQSSYLGIRNFWFKDKKGIAKNPVRDLIQDLDSLPIPDYDLDSHYVAQGGRIIKAAALYNRLERILIHSTRGCPNKCSYCCNSFIKELYSNKGKVIRNRSIEVIIKELVYYKNKFPSLKSIFFTDDTMFAMPISDLRLFAAKYREKINLPFVCYTSPNTFDEMKMQLFLDAGLNWITMGIQTGSEDINKNVYQRSILNETVIKVAQAISKYSLKIEPPDYHIIFCNPYESEKDLLETIALLEKLAFPFILTAFQLQFFPASVLYKRAQSDGLLNEYVPGDFTDYRKVLKFNTKEKYLNFIIYLMNGKATSSKIGRLMRYTIPFFISKNVREYFKNHENTLSFIMNIFWLEMRIRQLPLIRILVRYTNALNYHLGKFIDRKIKMASKYENKKADR